MYKLIAITIFSSLAFTACQNSSAPSDDPSGEEGIVKADTITLEKVWETDTLLTTAESVLYDQNRGVYYVSCIGEVPPWNNDGDGFIARIDEEGKILEQKWVTGLNGPKGMALVDNMLYVNDNDRLVSIDVTTGKIVNRMPVADAKNLNDIAADQAGVLYLSDSQTSTAYKVVGDTVETLVHDTIIGGLNGVFADDGRLLFAGFGSGKFFTFDLETEELEEVSDAMQGGDGIEKYGTGYFVSSWNGEIYHLDENWNRVRILNTRDQEINAADIEVVAEKELLLVPTFFDNRVMAYRIQRR